MYATIDGTQYFTNDEKAGAAIQQLIDSNNKPANVVAAAIKNALVVSAQTRDGLLFKIASRANEELAQQHGTSEAQAKTATETLRCKFQINPMQRA